MIDLPFILNVALGFLVALFALAGLWLVAHFVAGMVRAWRYSRIKPIRVRR